MKSFAVALCVVGASATTMTKMDYDFMKYVSNFNKIYETVEEFAARQLNFAEMDAHIRSVNENPESTHKAAHNKFSDWTWEEYNGLLGLKNMDTFVYNENFVYEEDISALPASWDWRAGGKVTPVKNQGSCGSCWAFSATEAVESAWAIAGNELVEMSPQELVDCTLSPVTENEGCNGGWYFWAWDWNKTNMTMLEEDYVYTSGTT